MRTPRLSVARTPPHRVHPAAVTRTIAAAAIALAWVLSAAAGCHAANDPPSEGSPTRTLTLFHAGSLSIPLRELSTLYEQRHPHVKVVAEAAGSRDTARKVSDLGRSCDVLASADYRVVDNLLLPAHADFNIRFATGEMAIAYTDQSTAREQLTATSWPDVLLRDDVTFGRSDPNRDPCGYRTVMVFQLAERYFHRPGLAQKLGAKHGRKYIRPKETDLLALLESGELDYLFIYRSVAGQHHLRLLALPDPVNLSSARWAERYAQATVEVTGRKPGEMLTLTGAPIHYSVTIPKRAPHRADAEDYVALLLSPEGRAIFERNGQRPLTPPLAKAPEHLPAALKPYVTEDHGQ